MNNKVINESIIPGYEGFMLNGGSSGVSLFHSGMAGPYVMRELAECLANAGFNVSVPLLAGHGTRVEDLNNTSWQELTASAQKGVLEIQNISKEKHAIVGHSLGGLLALYEATQNNNISCLITVSAPVCFPLKMTVGLRFLSLFRNYLSLNVEDNCDYQIRKEIYDRYNKVPLLFVKLLLKKAHGIRKLLSHIKCPILIIHGQQDPIVPVKSANIIYTKVKSKHKEKLIIESEAHHPLGFSAKETCFNQIEEFIKKWI